MNAASCDAHFIHTFFRIEIFLHNFCFTFSFPFSTNTVRVKMKANKCLCLTIAKIVSIVVFLFGLFDCVHIKIAHTQDKNGNIYIYGMK